MDDVAVLSSGARGDIVCTSLDASTAGTRLLSLQQLLPPIDVKADGCCPAIKNVPTLALFPARKSHSSGEFFARA